MLPDLEADVDEHVVINQSRTDVVYDTIGSEMLVDLSDLQNAVHEEETEDVDEVLETSRAELKDS